MSPVRSLTKPVRWLGAGYSRGASPQGYVSQRDVSYRRWKHPVFGGNLTAKGSRLRGPRDVISPHVVAERRPAQPIRPVT